MPECDYCGESFGGEDAYLDHLAAEHEGELGSIDQRRVAEHDPEGGGLALGPVILVSLLVLAGVVVVYVTFLMGGSAQSAAAFSDSVQEPTDLRSVHGHGPITVVVGGQEVDFSQPEYQVGQTQVDAFHFEGGDGSRYHLHARQVTLEFGLESVNIGVTNETLAFQGTTYDATEGDTVRYLVNGERVNPETYVLRDGDEVRVVAEKA